MTTQRHDPRAGTRTFRSARATSALGRCAPAPRFAALSTLVLGAVLVLGAALAGCAQVTGDFDPSICEGAMCDALWVKRFGGEGAQHVRGIASAGEANVVAGDFEGQLDFGSGALKNAGGTDVFVARLNAKGEPVWAKSFGSPTDDVATALAVDSMGDVFVTGYYTGAATFGAFSLKKAEGEDDMFVAKLSGGSGAVVWAFGFGGSGRQEGHAIAVSATGNVLVTGCVTGMTAFGDTMRMGNADGKEDAFFLQLDAMGAVTSVTFANGDGNDRGTRIAATMDEHALIAGRFDGSFSLPGLTGMSNPDHSNVFVAKVGINDEVPWRTSYFGATDAGGVFEAAGHVLLAGSFAGKVSFGATSLTARNASDPFLVELDPAGTGTDTNGKELGAFDLDGIEAQTVLGSALGSDGSLYLTGTTSPSESDADLVVVKVELDGKGKPARAATIWRRTGLQSGQALAVDKSGNVALAGDFTESFLFGKELLENAGDSDIFVAKLPSSAPNP